MTPYSAVSPPPPLTGPSMSLSAYLQNLPMTPQNVFLLVLVFRLVNTLAIRTFFQPDEYFQALEPAWYVAFGPDSGAWLTWEWHYYLRTSLHPLLFALPYRLLDLLSTLSPISSPPLKAHLLLLTPYLLQSLFAALSDLSTYHLATRLFSSSSSPPLSRIVLFLSLVNPWNWYVSVRTFSNSLETTLTIAALSLWPWRLLVGPDAKAGGSLGKGKTISLFLATLAILLRPTNIILWTVVFLATYTPLLVYYHSRSPTHFLLLTSRLLQSLSVALSALPLPLLADRLFFHKWVFPPLQWLHFNLSHDLAIFYGQNDITYYLSQGLPLLTMASLPFCLHGLYTSVKGRNGPVLKTLSWAVITLCAILTTVKHKEVRFISPLLPPLTIISAPSFHSYLTAIASAAPKTTFATRHGKTLLSAGLTLNIIVATYLGSFHQRASLSVLSELRTLYTTAHPTAQLPSIYSSSSLSSSSSSPEDPLFVLFLMPCHTTPWRSHLLYPSLSARALTCEPPLHTAPKSPERLAYRSENDRFYDNPVGFLGQELWSEGKEGDVPTYIVGFEGVRDYVEEFLGTEQGKKVDIQMEEVWRSGNGLFNEDWRRRGDMVIWKTGV